MDLRPQLNLSQNIRQNIEHRLELRQEARLKLILASDYLWAHFQGSAENYFHNLITTIAARITNPEIKQSLAQLFSDPFVVSHLIHQADILIKPSLPIFRGLIANIFWNNIKDQLIGELTTTKAAFDKAFMQPESLQREIKNLENLRSAATGDITSISTEIREGQAALHLYQTFQNQAINFELLFKLAFSLSDDKGSYFAQFFKDLLIIRDLKFVISERIINRFINRFSGIAQTSTPKDHQYGLINIIFEFFLISAGIISPDIFSLQTAKQDPIETEIINKTDEELQQIYHKWNLIPGQFFWNSLYFKNGHLQICFDKFGSSRRWRLYSNEKTRPQSNSY